MQQTTCFIGFVRGMVYKWINVKRLPLETKNTLKIRKWESRFYWDSSFVMQFATLLTPSRDRRLQNPTLGPMILKETKYNLHYGNEVLFGKVELITENECQNAGQWKAVSEQPCQPYLSKQTHPDPGNTIHVDRCPNRIPLHIVSVVIKKPHANKIRRNDFKDD